MYFISALGISLIKSVFISTRGCLLLFLLLLLGWGGRGERVIEHLL